MNNISKKNTQNNTHKEQTQKHDKEKRFIQIYDTSLRDGMQGMEINYTLDDKLKITKILDEHKIDYIEGGFPLSNEKESEFFRQVKKLNLSHSKIAAFGSTRRPNANANTDINIRAVLEADTSVVTIVAKSSSAHVREVIKTDIDENLRMTYDSVNFLKKEGREVILDLEHFFDGFKLDKDYSIKMLQEGTNAGADCLVLCDTNGGTLTQEIHSILSYIRSLNINIAPIGLHFHNDCELAVANSLAGLEYGAMQIQGTMNGWGERSGNTNLVSIIPNITIKDVRYTAHCADRVSHLTYLSRFISDTANIIPDTRQAFVGYTAFSHKAGQHADVIAKNTLLMEHILPEQVGNERHILLSELAGKSSIVSKLSKYGDFSKSDEEVANLIHVLKTKEQEGYEYEAAEASFELEMLRELKMYVPLFELKNYHLEMFKSGMQSTKTVCRLFVFLNGIEAMGSAVADGPVNALDLSIRNAIKDVFPDILDIKLTDYKVRVLNPENSAAAKVRVLISSSNKNRDWSTIGVDENIVEASWTALIDSYDYYLNVVKKMEILR